jgi:hypothetical protein
VGVILGNIRSTVVVSLPIGTSTGRILSMATDYDAPRRSESDDTGDNGVEDIAGQAGRVTTAVLDVDDGEIVDSIELPGADLSGEELTVRIIPKQANEFSCSSCNLVLLRSRLALQRDGKMICSDCI